jgi:hypothetical protein
MKETLLGHKNTNQIEQGYVYAPYISANILTGAYGGLHPNSRYVIKSIPERRSEKIEKILSKIENGF